MAKCVVCFMLLLSLILVEIGAVFNFEEDTPHAIEPRTFPPLVMLYFVIFKWVPTPLHPLLDAIINTIVKVIQSTDNKQPPINVPLPPTGGGNPVSLPESHPFLAGGPRSSIMDQLQTAAQQAEQLQSNQNNWEPTADILKKLQNALGGIQKIQKAQPELVKGPQLSPVFAKVVETFKSISTKLVPKKDLVSAGSGPKIPPNVPKSILKNLEIISMAFTKKNE